ncbi:MAG: ABC-2 family transporter protein [Clostridia bacterium]|jgi:ABC-2 type transport system permease protein|nr:ABC-2 family transporter protein [Clostridia bacterium]
MEVKNNIKLIFKYLILNIKKQAQYKISFILNIIMMIANDAFFIIQWHIIFSIVPSLGGYGFNEVLLIWSLTAGGFGLSHLFFNGVYNIPDIIYRGKLDVYLTQPKNLLLNIGCSSTDISAIGDIIYGFIALIIIGAKFTTWLIYFPLIICSAVIITATHIIYASLAFYIKRGDAIASSINRSMITFGTYPMTIFNSTIKIILYSIVPAAVIGFIPSQIILNFSIYNLLFFVGFAIISTLLAFFVFNKGLKKYSSGSVMEVRL